jgi:hypothetical protein
MTSLLIHTTFQRVQKHTAQLYYCVTLTVFILIATFMGIWFLAFASAGIQSFSFIVHVI